MFDPEDFVDSDVNENLLSWWRWETDDIAKGLNTWSKERKLARTLESSVCRDPVSSLQKVPLGFSIRKLFVLIVEKKIWEENHS